MRLIETARPRSLVVHAAQGHGREIALGNAGGLVAQAMDRPHEAPREQRRNDDYDSHGNRARRQPG